jgi:hypothetical protein
MAFVDLCFYVDRSGKSSRDVKIIWEGRPTAFGV